MEQKVDHVELESVSFQQLQLFQSVGRVKSVRQASEDCGLSQPAVTQAIAKLEETLGVTLLDRGARGSFLTESGEIFHARTVRFFELFHKALQQLPVTGGEAGIKASARRISRSQIRALVALFEQQQLDRAATSINVGGTSFLRAIRMLERNTGKVLLTRNAIGPILTIGGLEFARRMKLALQEIETGSREMALHQGKARARITIGAMPLGGSVLVASSFDAFLSGRPDVELKVVSGSSAELINRLKAGDLDFVIGLVPSQPDEVLAVEHLARTPFSVVARKKHVLFQKPQVTRDDLAGFDWIIGTRGSSRRDCFEALFEGGLRPNASVRTSVMPVIRYLLQSSNRLALMTDYELLFESDVLAAIPYGPIEPAPSIGIAVRAEWLPTRLQKELLDAIRNCAHDLSSGITIRQPEPA